MHHFDEQQHRRYARLIIGVALIMVVVIGGIFAISHGKAVLDALVDGQRVQQEAQRLGVLAPLLLGALVVLQEVTVVIPSEPLELAAGYAFGFWKGALIYLLASAVGCCAILGVVRLAKHRVLRLFSHKRRAWFQQLATSHRFDLAILIAFFIPGLPKDVLAYGAALAGMRPLHLVAVTTVGRLPSVLAITLGSSYAASGDWRASAVVFALAAGVALGGLLLYHHVKRKKIGKDVS